MALLLDVVLWALGILGAVGALIFIWTASQPDCDLPEVVGHYDYSSGVRVEEWSIKVRLGSIPYLKTRLLSKKFLCSIPSPRIHVVPNRVTGTATEEIDSDENLFEYSYSEKKEHLQIYLKKEFVSRLKTHAKIMFRITQPVSRAEISKLVRPSESLVSKSGATVVTLRLQNTSKLEIRDFEFVYPLPKANMVKIIDAFKINNTKRPLAYNLSDFVLRHEDGMATGSFPPPSGATGSNSLIGTVTLEPEVTEIIFEFA